MAPSQPDGLMEGRVEPDLVSLDFAGPKNAHAGFKDVLRRNRYDVSEMAVEALLHLLVRDYSATILVRRQRQSG